MKMNSYMVFEKLHRMIIYSINDLKKKCSMHKLKAKIYFLISIYLLTMSYLIQASPLGFGLEMFINHE
jgi:hypothetical protein